MAKYPGRPGDPIGFTLRTLGGDHLTHLLERATEHRYFEVPWPARDYDATRPERLPD